MITFGKLATAIASANSKEEEIRIIQAARLARKKGCSAGEEVDRLAAEVDEEIRSDPLGN